MLLDHNLPKRLRLHLPGHEIKTTREMGWETLLNGLLLRSAGGAGFDAFISIDKKLEYEQNLSSLALPIVVLDSVANTLPSLLPFADSILDLLKQPLDRALYILRSDGPAIRLTVPRH